MEMEYKDPSKRGRWIVLTGVVLAVVAGGAAFFLINNAQQQAGQSGHFLEHRYHPPAIRYECEPTAGKGCAKENNPNLRRLARALLCPG